jgi:hypothetical protein
MPKLEPQYEQDDPIASLYKMSTTAGVGSQEYVAINNVAIASAVLGFCTALAFLGPLFLVLALAGIICGFMALRQIRNSSGTQGGRAVAWIGVVLSLAMAGSVVGYNITDRLREREDERKINALIQQMGRDVMAGNYAKAYTVFDADFQAAWKLQAFELKWKTQQSFHGDIQELHGSDAFQFTITGGGALEAITLVKVKYANLPVDWPYTIILRKRDDQWRVRGFDLIQGR